nr:MAG TPA: hypothetical protein [Caudoviricetes sp.]
MNFLKRVELFYLLLNSCVVIVLTVWRLCEHYRFFYFFSYLVLILYQTFKRLSITFYKFVLFFSTFFIFSFNSCKCSSFAISTKDNAILLYVRYFFFAFASSLVA